MSERDVETVTFHEKRRGYNKGEVDDFLDRVGEAFAWYESQLETLRQNPDHKQPPASAAVSDPGIEPGWYPDPWSLARFRYWDGNKWTSSTDDDNPAGSEDASPDSEEPQSSVG